MGSIHFPHLRCASADYTRGCNRAPPQGLKPLASVRAMGSRISLCLPTHSTL